MHVNKNDPLLLIYSPSLITAEQELLQITKNNSDDSKSLLAPSRNKLKLYGLTDNQIDSIIKNNEVLMDIPIYSPINGTVTKMDAVNGKYVNEGDLLYELSDLGKVWMEADVYEQDISSVKMGSDIEITSISFPDKIIKSNVSFINSFLDPDTRTVKIRAEFDNADGILKPGMYVTAKIKSRIADKMLVIPADALLDTGTRQLVYLSLGNGKFIGKQVTVKTKIGEYYPVVSGVKENDNVVVNANFLIDSESQLKGMINK
jgi:Cu(I)/Ag(I) efflux system membrane fusion protein